VRKRFKEAGNRMIGIRSPELTADFGKLKKKNKNKNNNKTMKKNTPEAEKNVLLKLMFFNLLFS
jgi:hypothetical protein